MRTPARFSVDDREDSAARRAPLFHLAGTFQPPSAATDINGNQACAPLPQSETEASICTAVPEEAERVA
jgi:hypothetical protein